MGPRNPIQRLANRSKPAVDQQRVTLRGLLLESSKWMVLMITNIGASIYHGRDQSLIVIRNLMKLCKSLKNILHVASHSEWKLHYEIPGELR